MKFIIIPKEVYDLIPVSKRQELGIDNPRTNVEGTEVILHIEYYDRAFGVVSLSEEESGYQYPTYNSPSPELESVLSSSSWTQVNGELP